MRRFQLRQKDGVITMRGEAAFPTIPEKGRTALCSLMELGKCVSV